MSSKVETQQNKHKFLTILSGTLISISVTLILILLFALLIRFLNFSDSWIFPVNQVIKIISLVIGTVVILKKNKKNGFILGLLLGLIYFLASYLVFSILQGDFNWGLNNLYDLILTSIMGGLIGIILINFIK